MSPAAERLARRAQKIDLPPILEGEPLFRVNILSEGAITPHGLDADSTWKGIKSGKTAIRSLVYDPYSIPVMQDGKIIKDPQIMATTAGTIEGFDAQTMLVDRMILSEKEIMENQGPFIHYALAAAYEALSKIVTATGEPLLVPRINNRGQRDEERGWIINRKLVHLSHVRVKVGCGFGGAHVSSQVMDLLRSDDTPDTSHMMKSLVDRASSAITQAFGIWGGEAAEVAACASSGAALLDGIRAIITREAEMVLVIGTEGILELPVAMAIFDAMGALDKGKDPLKVSRSLHKIRRGFTISEGAVALLLTSDDWRRRHGIKNLYNIIGHGEESGAEDNTNPNPIAQERAMRMARRRAERHEEMNGRTVVVVHGTGTNAGETSEVAAVKRAFLDKKRQLYFTGPKRTTGHMQGANGNFSQFITGRALQEGVVPGTPRDGELMDELDGWSVPEETIPVRDLKRGLTNQFGFGDINISTVAEVADA